MANTLLAPDDQILLPSAQRNASTLSSIISHAGYSGCLLYLNITAASGTGGIFPQLVCFDPVTGNSQTNSAFGTTARLAIGLFVYTLYPASGLVTLSGGAAVTVLPSQFQIRVAHNDATNYTYSLGMTLLP